MNDRKGFVAMVAGASLAGSAHHCIDGDDYRKKLVESAVKLGNDLADALGIVDPPAEQPSADPATAEPAAPAVPDLEPAAGDGAPASAEE